MKRTLVGVVDVIKPEDASLAPTGQGASTIDAVISFVAVGIAVVVIVSVASKTIAFKCAVYCLTASATASFTGKYGLLSWLVGG